MVLEKRLPPLPAQIIELLPKDGSPILNRVLRTMLSRANQETIDIDTYFSAVQLLSSEGRIGRTRGQGGKIFLVIDDARSANASDDDCDAAAWPEIKLMNHVQIYLEGIFFKSLDLPKSAGWIVANTSAIGPRSGQWARPDFVAIDVMRFQLLPGCQVNVHSFELKTETGGTLQAVHEALAQTRFTHFGHLVWHLPQGSKAEARLTEIAEQCDTHGIGLILIRVPENPESWEIVLDPSRKTTPSEQVEGFLQTRLSSAERTQLRQLVFGEH